MRVTPIVIEAQGTISKKHKGHLHILKTNVQIRLIQKSATIATARILRKTTEPSGSAVCNDQNVNIFQW